MRYNAQLIKRQRFARGWSQVRLAKRCKLNQGTISNVERGRTNNPETLRKIAAALGLDLESLLIEDLQREHCAY